ncbi:MAG: uroporphyrinogen-III synthase [Gammaproteobacteria bacterium]|jgi:uroporphyrinogen-III synthase|nr:uroporphyrinogen-III synthase [Gammaproteobacteria bacterium]
MSQAPLAGVGVLVTRPRHQAEALCGLLADAGAEPIRFPAITIAPPTDPTAADAVIDDLDAFDLAIFISANAVEQGVAAVRRRRAWPEALAIASIGAATARALEAHGLTPAVRPAQRFDSEALLEHPALQAVSGHRVVIFRGEGGRELLAETLRGRGAEVIYAEVYRRALPDVDPAPLIDRWRAGEVDVAVITSIEGLENLCTLMGPEARPLLQATPLVVASDRVLQQAHQLDVGATALVAESSSDQGLFEAVVAWRRATNAP